MSRVIHSDGLQWPAPMAGRLRSRLWDRWRSKSVRRVEVQGRGTVYRFLCDNLIEYARCAGLFIKEPGTCEWIRRDVRQGDVFFDIGANIGIYTIMAAHQVGPAGKVVAFEPHAANFAALINNVAANGFGDRVIPCNAGAHASSGFLTFNYASLTAGTSNSQLDGDCVPGRAPFHPVAHELKPAVALDELVASGVLPRPTHVKIDVDGNEMEILAGMARLLSHADRPLSLSIEVNAEEQVECERRLVLCGYQLASTNETRTGAKRKRQGRWVAHDRYNAIFEAIYPGPRRAIANGADV
jgi:FkbM family methyltransferase